MAIRYLSGINVDSNTLFVDDVNNRVGIGTASPGSTLDVLGKVSINGDGTLNWGNAKDYGRLTWDTGKAIVRGESGKALSLGANGTQDYLYINTSGNVGIGTSSPVVKLQVDGTITSTGVLTAYTSVPSINIGHNGDSAFIAATSGSGANTPISFSVGNNNEKMRITADGNVGIGTTSPSSALDVSLSGGGTSGIRFKGWSDASTPYLLSLGTQTYPDQFQIKSVNGLVTMGIVGATGAAPDLAFQTNTTERMRITSAGNVGIGTTSPVYPLDLGTGGTGNSIRARRIWASGTGTDSGFSLDSTLIYQGASNSFNITNPGSYPNVAFTINNVGNVGIGTTSPSHKFVVSNGSAEVFQVYNSGEIVAGTNYIYAAYSGGTSFYSQGPASFRNGIYSDTAAYLTINGGTSNNTYFSGNVGIGTTAPDAKLVIVTGSTDDSGNSFSFTGYGSKEYVSISKLGFIRSRASDLNGANMHFIDNGGTNRMEMSVGTTSMNWYSHALGSTFMVFQHTTGNVGIGTTSPTSIGTGITSLDIQGSNAGGIAFGPSGTKNYIYGASTMYVEAHTTAVFSTSGSEKMRLTTGGQLIVGGTTVGYAGTKLQVGNTSDSQNGLNILTSTTGYGYILFGDGAGADTYVGQIWYYHADNYMGFQTNGSEKMRITSTGNVGIGTTAPVSLLHVNGSNNTTPLTINAGSNAAFEFKGNSTSGYTTTFNINNTALYIGHNSASRNLVLQTASSDRVTITGDGNVGIGIQNPSYLLDVNGSINARSNSQVSGNAQVFTIDGTNHAYYAWSVAGSRKAYAGFGSSGSTTFELINENTGGFIIGTNGGQQLIITSAGNVGIGTTSPVTTLQVNATSPAIRLQETGSGGDKRLELSVNSSGVATIAANQSAQVLTFETVGSERMRIASTGATRLNAYGSGSFTGTVAYNLAVDSSGNIIETAGGVVDGSGTANYVSKWSDANTLTDSIIYDNGTNVGIGTTSPAQKLDVSGNIQATTGLILTGNAAKVSTTYSGVTVTNFFTDANGGVISVDGSNRISLRQGGVSGTDAITIAGSGNVGIGTTSPAYKLDVNVASNSDALRVQQAGASKFILNGDGVMTWGVSAANGVLTWDTNIAYIGGLTNNALGIYAGGSEKVRITTGGNVGIGTTSPSTKLDVIGVGAFGTMTSSRGLYSNGLSIQNNTGEATSLFLWQSGVASAHIGSPANSTSLHIVNSYNTGLITDPNSIVLTNTGNVGIGTTSPNEKLQVAGNINAYVNGGIDAGLFASTSAGSTTIALRSNGITHFNGGNVGIGTTSPATKLHVVGYSRNDGGLLLNGNDADYREMIFTTSSAARWNLYAYGGESGSNAGSVLYLARYADNGDYIANVATFLRTNGYVGIATTTPTQQLHVSGNVRVTGAYYDSNNSAGSSGQVLSSTGSGTDWVSLSEITGVDGTGTANYIAKWSDTDTITNSQVFDNGTNVGINNASPKTKLDVNGTIGFGSKTLNISDTFVTVLTVNMSNHTGCYVKITAFGDWSAHSAVAYLGEFFLQNGASAYNEPGVIIRQVDNTNTDDIVAQIVDPAGTGTRDFEIQLKTTSASGVPFSAAIQYEVRGQYNSVS